MSLRLRRLPRSHNYDLNHKDRETDNEDHEVALF